jgi:hypothetical protein
MSLKSVTPLPFWVKELKHMLKAIQAAKTEKMIQHE